MALLLVTVAVGGTLAALAFWSQARGERLLRGEAEEHLYFSHIAQANHELAFDNLRSVQDLLDECPDELRGWEWGYLKRRCRFEPRVLQGPEKGIRSISFSGDGAKLAAAGADGSILVFDLSTGGVQRIAAHSKYVFSVAIHPDGKHLASAGADKKVKLWELTTGKCLFETRGHAGDFAGVAYALAFSHDGKRLAYGSDEQTITVCDVANGAADFRTTGTRKARGSRRLQSRWEVTGNGKCWRDFWR